MLMVRVCVDTYDSSRRMKLQVSDHSHDYTTSKSGVLYICKIKHISVTRYIRLRTTIQIRTISNLLLLTILETIKVAIVEPVKDRKVFTTARLYTKQQM